MKVVVDRKRFKKILTTLKPIAKGRGALPILNDIKLSARSGALFLTVTNLNTQVVVKLSQGYTTIKEDGAALVNLRQLYTAIASQSTGNVTMTGDDSGLELVVPSGVLSVVNSGSQVDEFPNATDEEARTVSLSGQQLTAAVSQVIYAVSKNLTRPVLTGVYVHSFRGELYFTATDSYRLSEHKSDVKAEDFSLSIPAEPLVVALKFIDKKASYDCAIGYGQTMATVRVTGEGIEVTILSTMITGTYPDYRRILPTRYAASASVDRQELISAIKTLLGVGNPDDRSVIIKLEINGDGDGLDLSVGESVLKVDGINDTPEPTTIDERRVYLNPIYTLDTLQAMTGETVTIRTTDRLAAVDFIDQDEQRHVVMPLKV